MFKYNRVGSTIADGGNQIIAPRLGDRIHIVLHADQILQIEELRIKLIKHVLFLYYAD